MTHILCIFLTFMIKYLNAVQLLIMERDEQYTNCYISQILQHISYEIVTFLLPQWLLIALMADLVIWQNMLLALLLQSYSLLQFRKMCVFL